MLIGVAILSLISVLFIFAYTSNRRQTELDNNANQIVSVLSHAKQKTIASENSASWGVHFEVATYTLFQGTDYNLATNKTTYNLTSGITLAHNFVASPEIIFTKLSGYPNQTGSITLYLNGTDKRKTICINAIGTIQLEANCPPASLVVLTSTTPSPFFSSSPSVSPIPTTSSPLPSPSMALVPSP